MRVEEAAFVVSAGRPEHFPSAPLPELAFTGRSNVGKSSLINRLLGRRGLARTSNTPGRTRTLNFYLVNGRFHFVDLPGYGYAKVSRSVKEAWWALAEGYLRQRRQLRGVVHILDVRHPPSPEDREMQEFLRALGLPSLLILTKVDKLARGQRPTARRLVAGEMGLTSPEVVILASAQTGEGTADIWRALEERLSAGPVNRSY
ncbi:MAG TPA: ribosome biogenesis GTP-binding protein YihA/YsxC [Candidatus Sulfotelmatobacter sp.]|nr:ribosome biogenesis GTP-binding protein YihA/YsxC [Candidatus Sulfotelmatobacter sp.]